MKRFLGILLILVLLIPAVCLRSEAATETYGNCGDTMTWRFESSTGTLVISGSGAMYSFWQSTDAEGYSIAPWRSLPIKAVRVGGNVTGLCSEAFSGQDELVDVSLPESLSGISSGAFARCTALKEVNLPESVRTLGSGAFEGCTALETVDISNVTNIGSYAFADCTGLKSVTMPETAAYLSEGAFENCTGLTEVEIPSGITSVGGSAFAGCPLETVTFPEGITRIGRSSFRGCTRLRSVSLPISLQIIDHYAFQNCTALEQVYYPGSGEQLSQVQIYSNNDPLLAAHWDMIGVDAPSASIKETAENSITLQWNAVEGAESYEVWHTTNSYGSGYTLVGTTVGTEFTHLEPVKAKYNYYRVRACDEDTGTRSTWSEQLQWFCRVLRPTGNVCGDDMTWAFDQDTGLLTISGTGEMYDYLSNDENNNIICVSPWGELPLTAVVFEGSVTGIGDGAFMDCPNLQSLQIPDSVTNIGKYLCTNCLALTEVKLPARVDAFDMESAFRNCTALVQLTLPEGKTSIEANAFQGCTALESVGLPSGLTSIGNYVFNACESLTEFRIPETVVSLGTGAFYGCQKLTSIEIPGSIQQIPMNCFRSCTALQTVTLPRSVVKVDSAAFFACDSLLDVYYGGTPADRENITFNSQNLELENAIWHYTYLQQLPEPVVTIINNKDGNIQVKVERPEGMGNCEISMATAPEGPYTIVTKKTLSQKYTVKNLEFGVKYYFRVRGLDTNSYAGSDYSEPASGYRKLVMGSASVTLPCSSENILSWSRVDQAAGYEIWRGLYGVSGELEKVGQTAELTFTDTTADRETSYYYRLIALHAQPESSSELSAYAYAIYTNRPEHSYGEWVRISEPTVYAHGQEIRVCSSCGGVETNQLEALAPAAPAIKNSVNTATGKPKVSWEAVEGADLYWIYRATSKTGSYSRVASTSSLSYTDSAAKVGINYYYKVKAVNRETEKESGYSNVVNRCCDLAKPVVTLKVDTASGKPKVTFEKISGAEKYYIVRATSKDGTYSKLATITGTSYIDTSAKAGTNYYYKVKALHEKDAADSAYSDVVNRVCDLAKPVVSITRSNGDPKISWKTVAGAEKYYIYRATSKDGTYKQVKTAISARSYTDTSAAAGKTYYYKVMAIHSNSAANSAYSSVKYITAK